MTEPDLTKCPFGCGAEVDRGPHLRLQFVCGSSYYDGQLRQSDKCRINQLEDKIARLEAVVRRTYTWETVGFYKMPDEARQTILEVLKAGKPAGGE